MDEAQHDQVSMFFCLQGLDCESWVDLRGPVQYKYKGLTQSSDKGTYDHMTEYGSQGEHEKYKTSIIQNK